MTQKQPVFIDIFRNQTSDITSAVFRLDQDPVNPVYNLLRGGVIRFAGNLGSATLTMQVQDANPTYPSLWSDTGDNAQNPFYSVKEAILNPNGESEIPFNARPCNYRFVLSGSGGGTNITIQAIFNLD